MATGSYPTNRTHITVLIEQKDFTPFASFRRASMTPSLATQSSTTSNGTITAGGGGGGEWKRGQRSSTTLHASIDCPDSLLASLSSITIVCIQPNLLPLPSARPLVLLVQLSDYIPPELSTTPSSICFPPMATPTPKSIQRALVPLKLVVSSLDGVNQRNDVAILAYSDNVHLPVEITNAAYNDGAHGLITPPFTPDSVEAAIHSALERHARQPPIPHITHTPRAPIYPPTPESTRSPLPTLYDSIDPLDTSHYNNTYDMHDHHDTYDSNEINVTVTDSDKPKGIQCPKADIPLTRRTSVDLGGLHLAVDSGNGSKLNANGSGWAGWDASLPGTEFDEARNELDVAQLLLSMHIQATAALANASSSSQANGTPYHSHQHSHPLQPSSPYSQPSLHRSPSANALNSMSGPTPIVNLTTTNPRTIYRLIAAMGSWHFEPYLLSPPETLLCVQLLFTSILTSLSTIPNIFPPQLTASTSSNPEERLQNFIQASMVPFISDLSKLYRRENRYHSFVHALDVLQAVYTFLEREGRVAPIRDMGMVDVEKDLNTGGRWTNKRVQVKKRKPRVEEDGEEGWSGLDLLGDRELFLLALAAIGHDVGHPGNSNAFLKNAQAPLSKIYDDRSALERMHCALLLRLLKAHGMGHLVSHESKEGKEGRWLISGTVLATDMSWHFEWVENFDRAMKARRVVQQLRRSSAVSSSAPKHQQQASISLEERRGSAIRISERDSRRGSATELIVKGKEKGGWVVEQTDLEVALAEGQLTLDGASEEETEQQDRLLVCQALMKCADISNPCRPHSISRHWSTVLLEEWAAQALLERHLGLPVSVVAEANEKVQCVGQVSFIKLFTQPLFDMVAEAVPGLSFVAQQCTDNRVLWEQRLATFEASTAPSSPQPQMVRPIPLALPILAPMSRYAKTVIPLSLPNLADRKKHSRAVRELAAMSPWYGMKSSGTSGTSAAGTSASGGGGNSSRVWTRSRPESVSSTSTLSSLPSTGAAAISPSTPTSTGFASSVVGGRSPASPTVSMAPFGLPLITSSATNLNATPGSSGYNPYNSGGAPPLNSVWDVDPEIADKAVRELRHGWAVRDGRKERRGGENEMVMAWAMGKRASGNLEVVQAAD